MEKSLPEQQNYFEAFIKAAQYLALVAHQQHAFAVATVAQQFAG